MKWLTKSSIVFLIFILVFASCKKVPTVSDVPQAPPPPPIPSSNKLPIAKAGNDQSITLPVNNTTLNGDGSTDPDGTYVVDALGLWKVQP